MSRHNFRRTYHGALAKLADPATTGLRPTAARVLRALRDHGPLTAEQLTAQLSTQGRPATIATIDRALAELAATDAAAVDAHTQRWTLRPAAQHPLLEAVGLHGAHDFRHTFSTWLEDAGIPARVIDGLMGHQATGRSGQHRGSSMGAHDRHTTPEMAARAVEAIQQRLMVVLGVAELAVERHPQPVNAQRVLTGPSPRAWEARTTGRIGDGPASARAWRIRRRAYGSTCARGRLAVESARVIADLRRPGGRR